MQGGVLEGEYLQIEEVSREDSGPSDGVEATLTDGMEQGLFGGGGVAED